MLDALKGYHQCLLDQGSQPLTTFITPFGRYKYLHAPYGISSISEHYDRRMAEAFTGLTGFSRVVDDIIINDSDEHQHASHVRQFLQRCVDKHISLNLEKYKFHYLLQDLLYQYRVDHLITDAISQFPAPTNRTDLWSFFGLVNQISFTTNVVVPLLTPLHLLVSTKNEFLWSPDHQQAFDATKNALTTSPVLLYFDASKPTRLFTDASHQGFGFTLQQNTAGTWSLIQAGSRFLKDTESRYPVTELEMLLVCWAVSKCRLFLIGLQTFTIIIDHNPLIPILNNHCLNELDNPRLQRLKMWLMGHTFTATWVKGSKMMYQMHYHVTLYMTLWQPMHLLNWTYTIILTYPLQKYGPSVTNTMKACTCKSCANTSNKIISTNYCGTSY